MNGSALPADRNWVNGTKTYQLDRKDGFAAVSGCHGGSLRVKNKKKTKDDGLMASLCSAVCDHQIGLSVNLMLLLFLTHNFFPRARRRTSKFFHMSYYNPNTQKYGCGTDDLYYVALWLVIFTGLRVVVMEYIFDPLARLGGLRGRKALVRFKEQAWLVCYCTCSWSLGMYLIYHSDFWFNLHGLWQGWPFREINGLLKLYYLFQWGFWLQQILVVNIEEKRKDYTQMFVHHIFTCALIFLSYGYYHTRVGVVILTIMDLVDIVLPTAKLLNYLKFTTACDIVFGLFMLVWVVTRHGFYLTVMWSIYADAPRDMAPGCYLGDGTMVPASATEQYDALGGNVIWANLVKAYTDRSGTICWNPNIRYGFLTLLAALQIICIMWFALIVKIAYGVITGKGAEDARSDDEGEDSDLEIEDDIKSSHATIAAKTEAGYAPVEHEVGVEDLTFTRRSSPGLRNYRRANRSSSSRSSGISIPGHGDRKELLGRIGCDKPT
ncbi:longevity-assurance protein-like protein [Lophiotrema nucula]|uniref:Longevity-assurance protein-like protein n=1 Tax=Lophiotrema nucula TaxID=690887 RepID=A0A6A5YKY7_9PLEO|nr:longevity-assurance protein-like protein [Lophiotrema nucula]